LVRVEHGFIAPLLYWWSRPLCRAASRWAPIMSLLLPRKMPAPACQPKWVQLRRTSRDYRPGNHEPGRLRSQHNFYQCQPEHHSSRAKSEDLEQVSEGRRGSCRCGEAYDEEVQSRRCRARSADRVTAFLDRCLAAGINVLIGDPGRAYLPRPRLRLLAEYRVSDVGEVKDAAMKPSAVFSLEPDCASLATAKRQSGGCAWVGPRTRPLPDDLGRPRSRE
jgi:hypothetical protein